MPTSYSAPAPSIPLREWRVLLHRDEHAPAGRAPVTEAITGIDLVHEQIRVASGGGLSVKQDDIRFLGHAIECRINAEDPRTFVPSPGTITHFHTPGGLGIRVDSGAYSGYRIPPYYDSLIGKLIVHGRNRVECMMRLRRALDEFVVDGIKSTLPLFRELVGNADIANGDYDIHWLGLPAHDPQMETGFRVR